MFKYDSINEVSSEWRVEFGINLEKLTRLRTGQQVLGDQNVDFY